MNEISILSFLTHLALSTLGAYWHYRKVCNSGRHLGTMWDYLVADHPLRSGSVGLALLGASFAAASSGASDFINPELVWASIISGNLPMPSLAIAFMVFQSGYQFDSQINKGSHE